MSRRKLQKPRMLSQNQTLESVIGTVPPLDKKKSLKEVRKIAREERVGKEFFEQVKIFQRRANLAPQKAEALALAAVQVVRAEEKREQVKNRKK